MFCQTSVSTTEQAFHMRDCCRALLKDLFFLQLNFQFSKFQFQKLDMVFLNESYQAHQTHRKQIWKRFQEFTFLLGVASYIIFLQLFFQYPFNSVTNFKICMSMLIFHSLFCFLVSQNQKGLEGSSGSTFLGKSMA